MSADYLWYFVALLGGALVRLGIERQLLMNLIFPDNTLLDQLIEICFSAA
jgi:hypothetical protein